jgi:hypothetical protein
MGGGPGSGGWLAVECAPEEQLPERLPKRIDNPRIRGRLVCLMCTRREPFRLAGERRGSMLLETLRVRK